MFRQWQANEDVTSTDWLIGKDIMGPGSRPRLYLPAGPVESGRGTLPVAPADEILAVS